MNVLYIKKKWIILATILFIGFAGWYVTKPNATTTSGTQVAQKENVIHMVTAEFKTTTEDGKEIEAYRFDPGTVFVPRGEKVQLSIYGVNGKEHPFHIEGTNISGVVKKGKETLVDLQFQEKGVYRLICTTHETHHHSGPMIAYIVVQ